jgi:hypothetical protein
LGKGKPGIEENGNPTMEYKSCIIMLRCGGGMLLLHAPPYPTPLATAAVVAAALADLLFMLASGSEDEVFFFLLAAWGLAGAVFSTGRFFFSFDDGASANDPIRVKEYNGSLLVPDVDTCAASLVPET